MSELTILIITNIVAPIITGIVTWLTAKKKYDSEVDSTVINNMKESLDFYKQLSDDNTKRLEVVLSKNQKLEEEMADLRKQMLDLALNICMDLTCKRRISKEITHTKAKDTKPAEECNEDSECPKLNLEPENN